MFNYELLIVEIYYRTRITVNLRTTLNRSKAEESVEKMPGVSASKKVTVIPYL